MLGSSIAMRSADTQAGDHRVKPAAGRGRQDGFEQRDSNSIICRSTVSPRWPWHRTVLGSFAYGMRGAVLRWAGGASISLSNACSSSGLAVGSAAFVWARCRAGFVAGGIAHQAVQAPGA